MQFNRLTGMVYGLLLTVMSSFAVSYYVAPNGSDGAAGTVAAPFATIAKARDAVKALGMLTEDANVYLRGGWYTLSSTLTFDQSSSGTNGKNIIYQSYTGEQALISGGIKVTGWTLHDNTKNIWKASVTSGLNTRQLFVNGLRARRAHKLRGDHQREMNTALSGATKTSSGYTTTDATAMASWKNISDIEFIYNGFFGSAGSGWQEQHVGVASISGTTITMKQPAWDECTKNYPMHAASWPTDIENAFELLNDPGEWYLDRTANTIYYIPRSFDDMAQAIAVVPKLETLVSLTGSSNIQFKGIVFAHATWLRPSTNNGWVVLQGTSGMTDGSRMPGNVVVDNGQRIMFEKCIFRHLGASALDFYKGANNCAARNCLFEDISGNGVSIGQFNSSSGDGTTNNEVSNSYITNVGNEYLSSIGICVGYAPYQILSHNELWNLPYSGISVGWGWSSGSNAAHDNLVEYNNIHHYLLYMGDGAGVYTLSRQDNTHFTHNWIHHYFYPMGCQFNQPYAGIYLDQGSSYITVDYNCLSTPHMETIRTNQATNNTITNNPTGDVSTTISANTGVIVSGRGMEPFRIVTPGNEYRTPLASYGAGSSITFTTNSLDAVDTISKVEFFKAPLSSRMAETGPYVKIGEVTAPPFTFSWSAVPEGNYEVKAVATCFGSQDKGYRSNSVTVIVKTMQPAKIITNTTAGLDYKYYEGNWSMVPNFSALTPVKTGVVTTTRTELAERNRDADFAMLYSGFINAAFSGIYYFGEVNTSDGCNVYIDGVKIMDNDGIHTQRNQYGIVGLDKGLHSIEIRYFDAGGSPNLMLWWDGIYQTSRSRWFIEYAFFHATPSSPTQPRGIDMKTAVPAMVNIYSVNGQHVSTSTDNSQGRVMIKSIASNINVITTNRANKPMQAKKVMIVKK